MQAQLQNCPEFCLEFASALQLISSSHVDYLISDYFSYERTRKQGLTDLAIEIKLKILSMVQILG